MYGSKRKREAADSPSHEGEKKNAKHVVIKEEPKEKEEEYPPKITSTTPFDHGQDILTQINMPGVCLINSKSQGGKSHAGHCIFYANRHKFAWGIGFGNTIFNENNMSFIPRKFKHIRYKPDVLRNLLIEQIKVEKEKRPLVFIYFDDCISDFQQDDKVLMEAVTQTFHYNIFIMITTQSINKIPNYVRENAFQVILFRLFSKNQIEAAYDSYGQDFESVKEFKKKINNNLGEHVFAFSNRHQSSGWKFCKCPPPPLPSFKFEFGPPDEREEKAKKDEKKKKKKPPKKKAKTQSSFVEGMGSTLFS